MIKVPVFSREFKTVVQSPQFPSDIEMLTGFLTPCTALSDNHKTGRFKYIFNDGDCDCFFWQTVGQASSILEQLELASARQFWTYCSLSLSLQTIWIILFDPFAVNALIATRDKLSQFSDASVDAAIRSSSEKTGTEGFDLEGCDSRFSYNMSLPEL
jgi:hypothetical protein